MTAFSDALKKAGIIPGETDTYDKEKSGRFTLEMKLYEMSDHILGMRIIGVIWKTFLKMYRII